jgi:hypothetical protein
VEVLDACVDDDEARMPCSTRRRCTCAKPAFVAPRVDVLRRWTPSAKLEAADDGDRDTQKHEGAMSDRVTFAASASREPLERARSRSFLPSQTLGRSTSQAWR